MSNLEIAPVHSMVGEPAVGFARVNTQGDVARAQSGAPYKAPPEDKPRVHVRDNTYCTSNGDTCKGRKAKGTEFCAGHLRSQGVIE